MAEREALAVTGVGSVSADSVFVDDRSSGALIRALSHKEKEEGAPPYDA